MKRVKLNFTKLTVLSKIGKARLVVDEMTGNANFLTPDPALADVTIAIDALQVSWAGAEERTKSKVAEKHVDEEVLDKLMIRLADYVQSASGGDELKIISSGLDIRREPAPVGDLIAPTDLRAEFGSHEGEVDLKWGGVSGSKLYVIEIAADPNDSESWEQIAMPTYNRFTATGLDSGTRYWFRVAAVGTTGRSPWSDPAMKMAA
jgi:hypothetical protein